MAAIAAQRFGEIASDVSEQMAGVTQRAHDTAPVACDTLDNLCGGTLSFLCIAWDAVLDLVMSSFFPYLLTTFALNLPPFAYGLASVFSAECNSTWLFFNAFLTAMHLVTSIYIVYRIREPQKDIMDSSTTSDEESTGYVEVSAATGKKPATTVSLLTQGEPDSWERIRAVMCYDMVLAVYYVLLLVWMIWQGLGTRKIIDGEIDSSCGRWVVMSIVCGFLYMGLGVVAWTGSLCLLRYNKLSQKKDDQSRDILAIDENGGIALA